MPTQHTPTLVEHRVLTNMTRDELIRAVNSHEALVAVAKRSLHVAEAWIEENIHEDCDDALDFKKQIEKAIKQAEGN